MSDILLGAIIGGAIAVAGSATVAWIHGHYSLKGKREENSARQQQESIRIQHDKNSQLISRIVEVRAKYLSPISKQLGKVQTSMSDFREELLKVIVPYMPEEYREEGESREVRVKEAKKQEFIHQLKSVDSICSVIYANRIRIHEESMRATDGKLTQLLVDLRRKVYSFHRAYDEMAADLEKSTTRQDFIYDFQEILDRVRAVNVSVSQTNRRIESLLAGADAGDE